MITSVNQFLTYLGLAEAGVGTATVVAPLYTSCVETDGRSEFNSFGDKKIL